MQYFLTKLNKKQAFTLAEVLITLAIIGVIAALTIPTVVRNYQKHQTVVRLKKTYSALANTTNLAIAQNGPITGWEVENNKSDEFADKYLIPYLKVSKRCYSTESGCPSGYTRLDGAPGTYLNSNAKFFLADGAFIVVAAFVKTQDDYLMGARVIIDTNGDKKPNIMGRDVFFFTYYLNGSENLRGKFIPYGNQQSKRESIKTSNCSKDNDGYGCAALIMRDGWKIEDDYPW